MMRAFFVLLAFSIVAGSGLGLLFPSRAQAATVYIDVDLHPGATNSLTCGWHGRCDEGNETAGDALDWSNSNNASVYWRSRAIRSDTATPLTIGTAVVTVGGGACTVVDVVLKDWDGNTRGHSLYVHTSDTGESDFTVLGHDLGYWLTPAKKVGKTVSDAGNCPWGGYHVHQTASGMTKKTSNYPSWVNAQTYDDTTTVDKRMFHDSWEMEN